MTTVKIGLCGLGTVGSGVFNVLARNRREIEARSGCGLAITHVGCRRDNPHVDLSNVTVSRDIFAVARDPEIDILLELIGGTTTAKELVLTAIEHGKHVITANKALIAEHGNEIFAAASAKGVSVAFEAAVAGGIPIIKALREGLAANKIEWLAGIINGTTNFILTEMRDKGREFHDVLKEAQELGYAEADPTFDVEGIDAAHKLVIMAALAFGMPLKFNEIFTEGVSRVEPEDVAYAGELGYQVKHLGIARRTDTGVEMRVHPTLVPHRRLLANVDGVMNAVLVKGDAVGPTLYYGPGAGSEPTASAVIADLVDVARTLKAEPEERVPFLAFAEGDVEDLRVHPVEEVETAYYMRMHALDKPGVLSRVAQILSDAGISIEALIQKEAKLGQDHVPLILLTNRAVEKQIMTAINEIEALASIDGAVVHIRMESLAG